MGKLNINGGGVDTNKKMADIDERFGPYTSTEAADAALGGQGRNTITAGLTVGILTANAGVKEYWYQPNKKSGLLELIPKGGNAADSPIEGNFASFDSNGNVVDSKCNEGTFIKGVQKNGTDLTPDANGNVNVTVQDGVTPHIDQTTKHWMIGEEDTNVDAEGKDAYQVYVASVPQGETPMTEAQWLASLKGDKGDNAVNPFKGWWPDLATLKAAITAKPGDSAYVKDASPATTWSIYIYDATASSDNYWSDSGLDADTSHAQTFETGEEVNEVPIDNTNLDNPFDGALAKAKDVAPLKVKLADVTALEEKVNTASLIELDGRVTGSLGEISGQLPTMGHVEFPIGQNVNYIRFLGLKIRSSDSGSSANVGYAFGHYEEETWVTDESYYYEKNSTAERTPYEYTARRPELSTYFRVSTTVNSTTIKSEFYAFKGVGETLASLIEKAKEEAIEEAKENTAFNSGELVSETSIDDTNLDNPQEGALAKATDVNNKIKPIEESLEPFTTETHGKNYFDKSRFVTGEFYSSTGVTSNDNGIVSNKLVLSNGTYTVQGVVVLAPATTPTIVYGRFDSSDQYIDRVAITDGVVKENPEAASGDVYGYVTFDYQNQGEAYIRFDIQTTKASIDLDGVQLEAGSQKTEVEPYQVIKIMDIAKQSDLSELEEEVASIMPQTNKLMKVVIGDNSIIVRSKFSETEDIIVSMKERLFTNNGNIPAQSLTFNAIYVGPRIKNDTELMTQTYNMRNIGDVVGAVGVDGFYYLFGQHGYAIMKIDKAANTLTDADLGSEWLADRNYGTFILAHVDNNYSYFVPKPHFDNDTQTWGTDWEYSSTNSSTFPSTLTPSSGAVYQNTISVTNPKRADVRVQTSKHIYIVDGNEVEDGTYYCDDFVFNEYVLGHNPAVVDATTWFDDNPDYNGELINFCRSFVFKGASVAYNSSFDVVNNFKINRFYGCIPQMPMLYSLNNVDYHSWSFIPKTKTCEEPFDSDNGLPIKRVNRNVNDLYDVDDLPDRCICYTKATNGNYKIGAAGGFSLVDGMSVPSVRNQFFQNYTGEIANYGTSSDTANKFYTYMLKSNSFTDAIVTNGFVKDFCCYYCWFNPNDNAEGLQVYHYKRGNGYVVYVHSQIVGSKLTINLPSYMEGMEVDEVIEKTTGANLLTDIVSCGKLYVSLAEKSTGNANNYIVFKLK